MIVVPAVNWNPVPDPWTPAYAGATMERLEFGLRRSGDGKTAAISLPSCGLRKAVVIPFHVRYDAHVSLMSR